MNFIDTHCHIYYDKYKSDIKQVLDRSIKNNINKLICVGVDLSSSLKSIELAKKYNIVFASAGYHPHESKDAHKSYLKDLEKLFSFKKVIAVGETGLDYYYNHSSKKVQNKIFKEQLELAKTLKKPVIIHCRDAEEDIINAIIETNSNNGVVHCFSGDINFANKLFDLGFYISFTGMITFNKNLINVIENVPLIKIMIETDSPYLAPIPYRGKRNEPWMVKLIAEKIADIKNISLKEVADTTTNNAEKLFEI